MKVIIIGGGSAGVSAATHLRRCDENAEIVIIEKTSEFAVSTCGLPYVLSGKIKDKDDVVGATVAQMQRIFQIDVKLNTEVLTIKNETKQILLANKTLLHYDKLVLAAASYDGGVFPVMEEFLHHLRSKAFQNRKVALIENGSWQPTAVRTMRGVLENMKDLEIIEPVITVFSTMKEENRIQLEKLAEHLR